MEGHIGSLKPILLEGASSLHHTLSETFPIYFYVWGDQTGATTNLVGGHGCWPVGCLLRICLRSDPRASSPGSPSVSIGLDLWEPTHLGLCSKPLKCCISQRTYHILVYAPMTAKNFSMLWVFIRHLPDAMWLEMVGSYLSSCIFVICSQVVRTSRIRSFKQEGDHSSSL